tara:strand:- start:2525 stop:2788 length:264 start_codon:yes stop_codon:yes gene_type:complete
MEALIEKQEINNIIIDYVKNGNPNFSNHDTVPVDESLVELGYIDSFGIIDLVIFLEGKFSIKINDDEINKENFGSINKISNTVLGKM